MRVFLVRHAVAHERNRLRWPDDAARPLTPDGKKRFRKAAGGLARLLPRGTVILTSPYVRARATAEMLATIAKLGMPATCRELASQEPASKAFELFAARREKDIVVVGHEPNLGKLLSAALGGERARLQMEFKKGGAACIEFRGRVAPGRATLIWMLPPRVLRQLR